MATKSKPKFFFMSGRLKWRGVPKEWEIPANDTDYEAQIKASDFIVPDDLEAFRLSGSRTVQQDLGDLKKILLKAYFPSNQKAKHYQNDYFLKQTILVVGTFFTSLVATATVVFNSTQLESLGLTSASIIRTAGVITAVVTFVTTVVAYLVQSQRSQYNWYLWRTVTEELRRHYFLYLAHLPPYHTIDCAEELESNVAQIKTQAPPDKRQAATAEVTEPRKQHSNPDMANLIDLYRTKRVAVQSSFYEARIEESKKNAGFVSFSGVALVALATLLSAVNSVFGSQFIVFFIALLPVIAALLVLFEKIYAWGRQVILYDEALKRLTIDDTIPPVPGHRIRRSNAEIFMAYVSAVENTLQTEMNQWGQSVLKDGASAPVLSAQETLELALSKSNLSKDQIDDIHKIFNAPQP